MRSHHAAHGYAAPTDRRVVLCPWESWYLGVLQCFPVACGKSFRPCSNHSGGEQHHPWSSVTPCKGHTKHASSTELEEVVLSCAAVGLQGCLSLARAAHLSGGLPSSCT